MMVIFFAAFAVGSIFLATIIGVVVIQQRRVLRTRSTFAGRLLTAQDRERAAIARELHDDLVQRLVRVSHHLREGTPHQEQSEAESVDGVVTELRRLAHGMHPTAVDHQDLARALRTLAESLTIPHKLDVTVEVTGDLSGLDRVGRLTCYRVAQEAIRNASEHASTPRVAVHLEGMGHEVQMTIRDWGAGFDVGHASDRVGLGLISMEERLKLVRGRLEIASQPGEGTTVRAIIPIQAGA